jgi:5-methyltetrahydrofolate--homocysteine methyltransferase
MSQELIQAITDMREEEALKITTQMLDSGADPITILDACRDAMGIIGQRFESGECFIPELILAGEMLSQISTIINPPATKWRSKKIGKGILGTVEGDIHDIAKDIVGFMLDVNGFG